MYTYPTFTTVTWELAYCTLWITLCCRNYTGPQKAAGEGKGSSRVTYSKASKVYNEAIEVDEDSHSKYVSDTKRFQAYERDIEDSEVLVFFVLVFTCIMSCYFLVEVFPSNFV